MNVTSRTRTALFLFGIIIFLAGAFQTGRWSELKQRETSARREANRSTQDVVAKRNMSSDERDFEDALIANAATVGFEELYELLRSAPVRTREQWIRELDTMSDSAQSFAALKSFYKTFVQLDPEAAAASLDLLKDEDNKLVAAKAMAPAAPECSMETMVKMLIKLPRRYINMRIRDYLEEAIEEWSSVDPKAAGQFFEDHPSDNLGDYDWILVSHWAQMDPDSARSWLEKRPIPQGASGAFDSLVLGWFEKDRVGAQNYALAHAGEEKFGSAIDGVARGTYLISPGEARGFIDRLPTDELKRAAIKEIANFTRSSFYEPHQPERPPAMVANWMLTFPQDFWSEAVPAVIEHWREYNPDEARVWIEQLPEKTRQEVIMDLCDHPFLEGAESIVPLAFRISDANARQAALEHFLTNWFSAAQPEEVLQRIADTGLTDVQKSYVKKLLAKLRKTSASE